MSTWVDLPPDLMRIIISMGNGLYTHEFYQHKQLFDQCLFDIKHRLYGKKNITEWARYWLISESIYRHYN